MAGAGFGEEVQISWRGGGWGGRSAPPRSTPDPNKTSVGCKDETAQRGYFIALLLACPGFLFFFCVVGRGDCGCGCCRCCWFSLLLLWIRTRTRTGPPAPYKSLSRRSEPELELEPVHPPRLDNCVVDPNSNSNSNSNRSTPPAR